MRAVNDAEDTEELYLLLKTSGDDVNLCMEHYRSMGENAQKYALSYLIKKNFADFEDVPEYQWYYKYAASGVRKGIVNGISKTRFGTGSSISRQDMAVMTVRALDYLGIDLAASVEPIEFTEFFRYVGDVRE